MLKQLKKLLGSANRIRKGMVMVLVQDFVLPWYEENGGEADERQHFELRDEVATKCHEALAGVVWASREDEYNRENEWLVTNVEAQILGGSYLLSISFCPKDKIDRVDPEEMQTLPLHAFLQAFEPVDEVHGTDYQS